MRLADMATEEESERGARKQHTAARGVEPTAQHIHNQQIEEQMISARGESPIQFRIFQIAFVSHLPGQLGSARSFRGGSQVPSGPTCLGSVALRVLFAVGTIKSHPVPPAWEAWLSHLPGQLGFSFFLGGEGG